ncbi:nucleotidyl transferase AbiEii/AbiGii toxin family protein [bacterium]|nr:nucleotidyl transferase AbiEii/AbiGii toxin family protein [bacterium]
MLNKQKHRLIMGEIIREIYTTTTLAPLLGFKGGTCAYFFYGLARFSVDLDFDLLDDREDFDYEKVLGKIKKIAEKYGTVKDARIKRHTIFTLLSYGQDDHNIKIEISIRTGAKNLKKYYEIKEYAGISVLAAKQSYAFAMKLVALIDRKFMVSRDVYDIYFFAKNKWDIDGEAIKKKTGKNTAEYLADCVKAIEKMPNKKLLEGLGELVNEKEKNWIRQNLKKETIFQLKNYQESLS